MKILLRSYNGAEYVWCTAKYNGERFTVNGEEIYEYNIVSVINDNRKNYLKCSSCGKIFPKNGNKFEVHKANAASVKTCLDCRKLRTREVTGSKSKIVCNDDGTFTRKEEVGVQLYCRYSTWTEFPINSDDAILHCRFRQCGDAHAKEIEDIFTLYPGLFDDIITVDRILDNGYVRIGFQDENVTEYVLNENLSINAYVNYMGIVDRFAIDGTIAYYSKKYDELFWCDYDGSYEVFHRNISNDKLKEIKEYIARLYK